MGAGLFGGGLFKKLFGGPKIKQPMLPQQIQETAPAPAPVAAPVEETKEESRKATQSRAALYETEGGAQGAELDPDQVQKRRTLLGN